MVPAVAVKHRDRVPSGFQDKLPTMLKEQLIAEIARAARAIYPTSSSPISLAPADNSRHDYQTETAVRIAAERGSPGEAGEIARALVAALAGSTVIASAVALPDGFFAGDRRMRQHLQKKLIIIGDWRLEIGD